MEAIADMGMMVLDESLELHAKQWTGLMDEAFITHLQKHWQGVLIALEMVLGDDHVKRPPDSVDYPQVRQL